MNMDITSYLTELVREYLGPTKIKSNGWHARNCMLCHLSGESMDTRNRLGIRYSPDGSIGFHCFNCGASGRYVPGFPLSGDFITLLTEINVPEKAIKEINFHAFMEATHVQSEFVKVEQRLVDLWEKQEFPEDAKSIEEWLRSGCRDKRLMEVTDYAYSRGVEDFSKIFWTPTTVLGKPRIDTRFLIPMIFKGNVLGYVGRNISETSNRRIPKYLNVTPPHFIYNIDNQYDGRKYVILYEGILDAFLLDGICCMGNEISEEQAKFIGRIAEEIVVVPDFDLSGRSLVDIALEFGWKVSFPDWYECKDAGDAIQKYGKILTLESILDSVEEDPMTINLKWNFKVGK